MWFDLVIGAILLITTMRGAIKGIVWQLAAIGSLVLCFIFAQSGSLAISPLIPLDPPLNRWVGMFAIYVIFSFIAFGTARMLREGIERAKFVEYDRHLGAILGFVKGAVMCIVLTFFAVTISASLRPTIIGSYSGHASVVLLDKLAPVLPDELHAIIDPYLREFEGPDGSRYGRHDNDPLADERSNSNDGHRKSGGSDFEDPFEPRSGNGTVNRKPSGEPQWDNSVQPASRDTPSRRNDDPFGAEPRTNDNRGSFTGNPGLDNLLRQLPSRVSGAVDEETKRQLLEAVRDAAPEERRELIDRIGRTLPDLMRTLTEESSTSRPAPKPADILSRRSELLKEISTVYSDFPESQAAVREEFEDSLRGVPERVAVAVLEDWRSDLFAVDREDDPDPSTGVNTPLDERIVRQLNAARVPMSSLSEALQTRLRNAQRR